MEFGFVVGILIVIVAIIVVVRIIRSRKTRESSSYYAPAWSGTFYVEPIYADDIMSYLLSEYMITAPAGRRFLQVEIIRL